MIPQTLGAVLAFLGLVAPGLVFELLRERRRPSIEQTAFREASRVALTSLVFTVAAVAILAMIRLLSPVLFADPVQWLDEGDAYLQTNLGLVAWTLLGELLLACGLAALTDRALRRSARGHIVEGSIWFQLFRQRCPDRATPWVHLRLEDETELRGYVGDYTPDQKLENRELTIEGPKLQMKVKNSIGWTELRDWSSVSVRGDSVSWIKVTYVADADGAVVPSRQPTSGAS